MNSNANKEMVLRALQYWNDKELAAFFDLFHEELTYLLPYRRDGYRYGGSYSKDQVVAAMREWRSAFTHFSLTILSATAEENRVAVEFAVTAEGPGSAKYRNHVCFAVTVKDGKMHTVNEFLDPFEVIAYVGQVQAGSAQ